MKYAGRCLCAVYLLAEAKMNSHSDDPDNDGKTVHDIAWMILFTRCGNIPEPPIAEKTCDGKAVFLN
jgi:hypothetical protein